MVVSEQISAMRSLGTDPTRRLVTPRMVAMLIMLPLLTVICDTVGMLGGWVISSYKLLISTSAAKTPSASIQAIRPNKA